MDLSQSFPRIVDVNGVFDFEGQGISYQPQRDSIAFVMLQEKNVPIWPSKQNYWTSEARWQKARVSFKIYIYFEVYIHMDKVKELQIS